MGKRQANIFELYEEAMRGENTNLYKVAKDIGEDYKYLRDLFNDRILAKQVRVLKKLDRLLLKGMAVDLERYDSGDNGDD